MPDETDDVMDTADAATESNPLPEPASELAPVEESRRQRRFLRRFLTGTWRWTKRVGIAAAVLCLIARMTLGLWLPPLTNHFAKGAGVHVEWADLDLSILGLSADLGGVRVVALLDESGVERDGQALAAAAPLALLDDLGFDVDVSALITGDIRVHRVEVGGLEAWISRDPAGVWNFETLTGPAGKPQDEEALEELADEAPEDASAPPDQEAQDEETSLDFSIPVEIASVAIQGVRLHLDDAFLEERLTTTIEFDATFRDVGNHDRSATIDITARAADILDTLRIEGDVKGAEATLQANLTTRLDGLGVARLGPYLAAAGIRPAADKLNASFQLTVDLVPIPSAEVGTPPAVGGSATVGALRLDADGEPALTVETLSLDLAGARSRTTHVAEVLVSGVRGHVLRLADGTLRVAGLDLVGAPAATSEEPEPPAKPETSEPGPPQVLLLDEIRLADIRLLFDDRSVRPAAAIDAAVEGSVRQIALGSGAPSPLALDLQVIVEGTGKIALGGTAVIEGPVREVELQLSGSELTLGALTPYLTAAGLESTLENGLLSASVSATMQSPEAEDAPLSLQASVENVKLSDGDTVHLSLDALRVTNFEQDPSGELRIEAVTLEGANLPAALIAGGGFEGFGVRSLGAADDAAREAVGVGGAAFTASHLTIGGDGGQATIDASMELVGLANQVQVAGRIQTGSSPMDLDADIQLTGEGFSYTAIEGILAGAGLASELENGSGSLSLKLTTRQDGDVLRADAELSRLKVESNGTEFAALDLLQLSGAAIEGPNVDVESVRLAGARLPASRSADGVLHVFGVAAGGPAGPPVEPGGEGAARDGAPAAPTAVGPDASAPKDAEPEPGDAARFTLGLLQVDQIEVTWSDEAVAPAVATVFTLGAGVQNVRFEGGELSPLRAKITAALEGAVDAVDIQIAASAGAAGADVDVALDVSGLRAGPLASYLPKSLPVLLQDGRFNATLHAESRPLEDGGQSILATVGEMDFRDGAAGEPLLAFEQLRFDAPRIDPEARMFEIAEVSVSGFAFDVQKTSATRYEMLGIAFDQSLVEAEPVSVAEDAPESSGDGATGEGPNEAAPVDPVPPSAGPAGARSEGDAAVPEAAEQPPTVTLALLDIGIDRLRYIDRTRKDAVPLDLSLALKTPGPQELLRPDPMDLPPIEVALKGAITPLVRSLDLTLRAEPFAADPRLTLTALIEGINGAALERIDPALAGSLDPSAYVDGSLEFGVEAQLAVARRGPMDFDFARGFGATLAVAPFALRSTPGAEPTGFERFDVEVKRISPRTGDVRVASAELSGIRARVEQRADGMHVAGLRFPAPPEMAAEEGAAVDPAPEPNGAGDSSVAPEAPEQDAESAGPQGPEFAIDRLVVSGVDFAYSDLRVEPPFLLPLADAQLEVQRFTTRTFDEARPFSFRLILDAGEVSLPERSGADNLLFGFLGSVAEAATLQSRDFKMEDRRVWDLFEVTGRMSLGPEIRGRVNTNLLGLELPAFRGLAAQGGVEIGDGLVDSQVKLRFRNDGGLGINSKTVASYLSLSEPPGGPITKYLQLPAPLDTVLFLLRNEDGAQEIPVRLDIPKDGVSASQVASLAAQTLGLLITDAVSAAPLRVLGPLTDVAGALGLGGAPLTADSVTLSFDGGAATLAAARVQMPEGTAGATATSTGGDPLALAAKALRLNPDLRIVLQASLGAQDLEVANRIANPPREVIEAMIQSHRERKAVIERERSMAAARAKAQLAAGSLALVERTNERLQALDGDRRDTELALDNLFARIRPGAERRAEMRTRNAAIALGKERMERVRRRLVELAGPAADARIDVRRPRYVPQKEDAPLPELGVVTVTPQ